MSEKIQPLYLERKAILYVRQSSAYQVSHNEESRRLQYGMQTRDGYQVLASCYFLAFWQFPRIKYLRI